MQQRQDSLRALVGAIVPDEYKLRAELDRLEVSQRTVDQDLSRMEWRTSSLQSELVEELGVDPEALLSGRMAVEPLRDAAKENFAHVAKADPATSSMNLEGLRSESDRARERVDELRNRESALKAQIPEIKRLIDRITAETPGASARADSVANPICPICEVPIDRALAEGCKLSHKLPNLDEARQRLESLKQERTQESNRLAANEQELARITQEMPSARRSYGAARQRLREAERIRDARSGAWFKARRLIDDVARLDESLARTRKSPDSQRRNGT